MQLSEDLARAVIEYNRSLRHELACNESLKVENQLSREFISLTLSIERKQQQQQHQFHVDTDDESFSPTAPGEGMVWKIIIWTTRVFLRRYFSIFVSVLITIIQFNWHLAGKFCGRVFCVYFLACPVLCLVPAKMCTSEYCSFMLKFGTVWLKR